MVTRALATEVAGPPSMIPAGEQALLVAPPGLADRPSGGPCFMRVRYSAVLTKPWQPVVTTFELYRLDRDLSRYPIIPRAWCVGPSEGFVESPPHPLLSHTRWAGGTATAIDIPGRLRRPLRPLAHGHGWWRTPRTSPGRPRFSPPWIAHLVLAAVLTASPPPVSGCSALHV